MFLKEQFSDKYVNSTLYKKKKLTKTKKSAKIAIFLKRIIKVLESELSKLKLRLTIV